MCWLNSKLKVFYSPDKTSSVVLCSRVVIFLLWSKQVATTRYKSPKYPVIMVSSLGDSSWLIP